jgi:hypothetical protein
VEFEASLPETIPDNGLLTHYQLWAYSIVFSPTVCRPPEFSVATEFSEYTVNENIRSNNFALQVCAVAVDVPFRASVSIDVVSGTAEG